MAGDYAFALSGFRISLQRPNYAAIAVWEGCLAVELFLWELTDDDKRKWNYDSVFSAKKNPQQINKNWLSCQTKP